MWSEERGFYFDLDAQQNQLGVRTVAAFWTLIAGVAPPDRAARLVAALEDPAAYDRPHPVPTVAADEPGYVAEGGYWRGGVWAPINQMVVLGLDRAGYHDLATRIATKHVDALARIHEQEGTVFEYYSPERFDPGDNDHRDFVGWSGTGPIGFFVTHVVGVQGDAEGDRLTWRLSQPGRACGVDHYWFAGRRLDLRADPEGDGWRFRLVGGRGLTLTAHTPDGATATAVVDSDDWSLVVA